MHQCPCPASASRTVVVRRVDDGQAHGHEGPDARALGDVPVEVPEQLGRIMQARREGAKVRLRGGHQHRGADALARDVARA